MKTRNSSIEFLKIIGIFFIVIGHCAQSLCTPSLIGRDSYLLDAYQQPGSKTAFFVAMLMQLAQLGNYIFFISSAWFLIGSKKSRKEKALQLALDTWIISMIYLGITLLTGKELTSLFLQKQFMPLSYANNWYIPCYILLYLAHPALNMVIEKLSQKKLLRTALFLFALYPCFNLLKQEFFFPSPIILWISVYFTVAYVKLYLPKFNTNKKLNIILAFAFMFLDMAYILITNIITQKTGELPEKISLWSNGYNPFLILSAISLFIVFNSISFKDRAINYISSLSILVYLIHENLLFRKYFRPKLWSYIHDNYGYGMLIVEMIAVVGIVFIYGLVLSIIYKHTIQKFSIRFCKFIYPILARKANAIENKLMKIK